MTETKFEDTLTWAKEEEKIRKIRGNGISSFYLVIASFMILSLMIFIVYIMKKYGDEYSALDMMKDPNNEFYDESDYVSGSVDEGFDDDSE